MRRGIRRAVVAATASVALSTMGVIGASASGAVPRDRAVAQKAERASQAPLSPGAQLWVARYNGLANGYTEAASVAVSPGGGTVFVTGAVLVSTATGYNYATVAYNAATGAQLWVQRYAGPGNSDSRARAVAVSPGGGTVYVTGASRGATSGFDYATIAYNAATGARLWVKRYNGPGNSLDQASSLAVSPGGGTVFVTGESAGTTTFLDYATVAYNAATGARLWVKRYNGPGNEDDQATAVAVSPTGGTVYVTGSSYVTTTNYDYTTIAYNAATGAQQWISDYNGPGNGSDVAFAVAVSPSGRTVFVTGGSQGTTAGADYATVAYSG